MKSKWFIALGAVLYLFAVLATANISATNGAYAVLAGAVAGVIAWALAKAWALALSGSRALTVAWLVVMMWLFTSTQNGMVALVVIGGTLAGVVCANWETEE